MNLAPSLLTVRLPRTAGLKVQQEFFDCFDATSTLDRQYLPSRV